VPVVIPDTGVLIDLYRAPERAGEVAERGWVFRISAVVQSELRRGAENRRALRFVDDVARSARPIPPTASQWLRCGEHLAWLRRERDFDARGMRAIQNDLLIALTARDLGLPVVTTNSADFAVAAERIRGLRVIEFPAAS
jgi:predicted nucleic acid-binding protein